MPRILKYAGIRTDKTDDTVGAIVVSVLSVPPMVLAGHREKRIISQS